MKGDFSDCSMDFEVLSPREKMGILKTAKTLLKEQNRIKTLLAHAENALLPMEAGRQKRA